MSSSEPKQISNKEGLEDIEANVGEASIEEEKKMDDAINEKPLETKQAKLIV